MTIGPSCLPSTSEIPLMRESSFCLKIGPDRGITTSKMLIKEGFDLRVFLKNKKENPFT